MLRCVNWPRQDSCTITSHIFVTFFLNQPNCGKMRYTAIHHPLLLVTRWKPWFSIGSFYDILCGGPYFEYLVPGVTRIGYLKINHDTSFYAPTAFA